MKPPPLFCRRLAFSALLAAGIAMTTSILAQTEVAKGSALRKSLFDLARPAIEAQAKQAVLFQGSLQQLDDWAFFSGSIVNAKGATIQIGEAESGDTAILWARRNGTWVVVEAETGFTDVLYFNWPKRHGVPRSLLGL